KTLTAGGADSLLARYALKHINRIPRDWPQPLRLTDVKNDLGGEPQDQLRRLIRDPEDTVASWGTDTAMVRERLREAFGIDLVAGEPASQQADEAVILLALAEAWVAL